MSILDLFPTTSVKVKKPGVYGPYGPGNTTTRQTEGMVSWQQTKVVTKTGDEALAAGTVALHPDIQVTTEDTVVIEGTEYAVLSVEYTRPEGNSAFPDVETVHFGGHQQEDHNGY